MALELAKGVRDIPPEEKILKEQVVDTLKEIFKLYGFSPLETPILERYETLAAKFAAGEASDALKEIFRLKDQGKRDLGLRFDLTVPLARFVAMNPNLKLPFKRYAVGEVFRDGPIKLGRTREFWQMDIDTVGTSSMLADAEIIAMTDAAFSRLGLKVKIKINNRKLLNGILEQAGISRKEEAIISIDKLDKIGTEGVSAELQTKGYTKNQINSVLGLLVQNVSLADLNKKVTADEGKEALQELGELFSYLKQMGVRTAVLDVSLARGLAYYTGTVFEAYLQKGEITSSLAGGGRYDNMIGKYIGGERQVPAVGIAFGLVPIIEALRKESSLRKEYQPKLKTWAKVLIIPINTISDSLKIAQQLRTAGINTDFAFGKKGVSKNLEYANALGIPYAAIIGEDELKKKKALLKDMASGTEQLLAVDKIIKKLK